MTNVTRKIVDRYSTYYKMYIKSREASNYKEYIAYFAVLQTIEEILLNDCGLSRAYLDKISHMVEGYLESGKI